MSPFVIDASIAAKWVIEEQGTPEAVVLHERARLMAPDLLAQSAPTFSGRRFVDRNSRGMKQFSQRGFFKALKSSCFDVLHVVDGYQNCHRSGSSGVRLPLFGSRNAERLQVRDGGRAVRTHA